VKLYKVFRAILLENILANSFKELMISFEIVFINERSFLVKYPIKRCNFKESILPFFLVLDDVFFDNK
jgi:hypothetical protein